MVTVTLFRIPIVMHWTFIGFFLFLLYINPLFTLMLYSFLMIHEYSHVFVGRFLGYETNRIEITPLGAAAMMQVSGVGSDMLFIALAGPISNFLLAGAAALLLISGLNQTILISIITINLALGLFNMLPAYPLDGGRVLQSILMFWHSEHQSLKYTLIVTMLTAIASTALFYTMGMWLGMIIMTIIGILGYSLFKRL